MANEVDTKQAGRRAALKLWQKGLILRDAVGVTEQKITDGKFDHHPDVRLCIDIVDVAERDLRGKLATK